MIPTQPEDRIVTFSTKDTSLDLAKRLGAAAAGAQPMYLLDPERVSARRAQSASAVCQAGMDQDLAHMKDFIERVVDHASRQGRTAQQARPGNGRFLH